MCTLRVILMEWMLTTVMWFRRLVAELLSPQTRFEPGPIHVRISGGQSFSGTGFFSDCVGFPLSVSFHQFSSGGRSDIETGFSSSVLAFPCQYHSTSSPLAGEVTLRPDFLRVCWFSPVNIIPRILLLRAKWHWDRVFFECVGFPL